MKTKKTILAVTAAASLLCACSAPAQDATNPAAAEATTFSGALDFASSVTNVVFIPFAKYDLQNKQAGFGAAGLYRVTDNFWAGGRFDRINGQQTTAGVQAQLQTTLRWKGLSITPFVETSVGLGSSSLYGSAGPGAFVNLWSKNFRVAGESCALNLGLVADYEHVINGSENYNCINAGPLLNLSF